MIATVCMLSAIVYAEQDRIEAVKQALAEKTYQMAGEKMSDKIAAKGLSPSDSEKIAKKGYLDVSSGLVDAALTQAKIQSVPVDEVLEAIELSIEELDTGPTDDRLTRGLLDDDAIGLLAAPCLFEAAMEMGIAADSQ